MMGEEQHRRGMSLTWETWQDRYEAEQRVRRQLAEALRKEHAYIPAIKRDGCESCDALAASDALEDQG